MVVKISEKCTAVITRRVITRGYVDCPVFSTGHSFRFFGERLATHLFTFVM